jgi:hypothetical protein
LPHGIHAVRFERDLLAGQVDELDVQSGRIDVGLSFTPHALRGFEAEDPANLVIVVIRQVEPAAETDFQDVTLSEVDDLLALFACRLCRACDVNQVRQHVIFINRHGTPRANEFSAFSQLRPLVACQFPGMFRRNETVQLVRNREIRVPEQHSWAGVPHDHPGSCPGTGLVTMDRAIGAGRLVGAVEAFLQAHIGIVEEALAVVAQICMRRLVARVAVNLDHFRHRMPFPVETLVQQIHCWIYPPLGSTITLIQLNYRR